MKRNTQSKSYYLILTFIIIFSCEFVAYMGYINFKSNYKDVQNQIYSEVTSETIRGIERSIRFGKTMENYYGIEQLFNNIKKLIGEKVECIITDNTGIPLYCSLSENDIIFKQVVSSLSDKNAKKVINQIKSGEDNRTYTQDGINYIIQPIKKQSLDSSIQTKRDLSGLFFLIYPDSVINQQLTHVRKNIMLQTLIVIIFVLLSFWIGNRYIKRFSNIFPVVLIMVAVIIQSIFSIFIYKESYKNRITDGGKQILSNLNNTISNVLEEGAELAHIDGVEEYLTEKVRRIPLFWNMKILKEIANTSKYEESRNELLIYDNLYGKTLKLSAELSDNYITEKIMQIILLMISTMIIMIIFIMEIIKIPKLILYHKNKEQISNSLRLTSFLCGTAEYICVPYAAMMIRDINGSLFGLSVGMTASLPLVLGCLTQMLGMIAFPKKISSKMTLILSGIMMIICNIVAFSTMDAMTIILCRGLAGIAYAGFKQVSNYVITRGYCTESQRSQNLSQDNAGLLGGITCGAGLGAIISSNAGYSATFLASILIYIAYILISFCVIPWKWLKTREEKNKKGNISLKKMFSVISSWETLAYVLFICIPLNIAIMLIVTLIPGICQNEGISTLILSYCYIVNGIAGIYIGPALVNQSKKRFGIKRSIGFAFALIGLSIFILKLPFLAVILIISSMFLGFIDGFSTPLSIDLFLKLKIVKKTVDESTALIFCVILSYVFATIAPVVAEFMLMKNNAVFNPLMLIAIGYVLVAALFIVAGKRKVFH